MYDALEKTKREAVINSVAEALELSKKQIFKHYNESYMRNMYPAMTDEVYELI